MKPDEAQRPSPTRACAACRERRPAAHLLRFAWDGERVVPDLRRRMRGRGMHLCASATCFGKALKKRAFARQLRRNVRIDASDLRSRIASDLAEALRALFADGPRSAGVVPGEPLPTDDARLLESANSAVSEGRVPDSSKRARAGWLASAFAEFTSAEAGDMHPAAKAGQTGRAHLRFERNGAA